MTCFFIAWAVMGGRVVKFAKERLVQGKKGKIGRTGRN